MTYVLEMKVNGEWYFLGECNSKEQAEIAYKNASLFNEVRIVEK